MFEWLSFSLQGDVTIFLKWAITVLISLCSLQCNKRPTKFIDQTSIQKYQLRKFVEFVKLYTLKLYGLLYQIHDAPTLNWNFYFCYYSFYSAFPTLEVLMYGEIIRSFFLSENLISDKFDQNRFHKIVYFILYQLPPNLQKWGEYARLQAKYVHLQ